MSNLTWLSLRLHLLVKRVQDFGNVSACFLIRKGCDVTLVPIWDPRGWRRVVVQSRRPQREAASLEYLVLYLNTVRHALMDMDLRNIRYG
jgi:hypothetical protein